MGQRLHLDREIRGGGRATFFDLYSDYENWKRNSRTFQGFAALSWAGDLGIIMTGRGPARTVAALPVSVDFFSTLGVPAALGRTFENADLPGGCAIVLSHKFRQATFGGQRNAIGQSLRLNDHACTVPGLMPADFASYPNPDSLLWVLMTPAQAARSVWRLRHWPLQAEFTWLAGRNLRISLIVLFAAVTLVRSICCVNVANLLLSRSLVRQREMAIRAALGSGRVRMLRPLITESLLLSLIASVLGVAIAGGAVQYFRDAHPIELPPATVVGVNGEVLAFTVLLSIATALLFGLAPAWKAAQIDLIGALKAGGRSPSQDAGWHRFGKALIVVEVALPILLLAGAGLLIRSVENFTSAPLGFVADGLMTAKVQLPPAAYSKPEQRFDSTSRLSRNSVRNLGSKALSTTFPTQGTGPVNEALVARYFATEDPIGKHIREFDGPERQTPWLTIVGVVADEKRTEVSSEMSWADSPVVYHAWDQNSQPTATLLIRAGNSGMAAGGTIQRILAAIDPDVSVSGVEPVPQTVAKVLAYPRFRAIVLAAFAGLAVLLAMVGLYGVLSHLVTHRTHEIGVRMALGAQRGEVLRMIVAALAAMYIPARRAASVDPLVALRYE